MNIVTIDTQAAIDFNKAFAKDPAFDGTQKLVGIFQEALSQEGKISVEGKRDKKNLEILLKDPRPLNHFLREMEIRRLTGSSEKVQQVHAQFVQQMKSQLHFGAWGRFVVTLLSIGAWFGCQCASTSIANRVDVLARDLLDKVHKNIPERHHDRELAVLVADQVDTPMAARIQKRRSKKQSKDTKDLIRERLKVEVTFQNSQRAEKGLLPLSAAQIEAMGKVAKGMSPDYIGSTEFNRAVEQELAETNKS